MSVTVLLNITNKMERYTILFITVKTLHVSGGFSAHHQELKNCTHSIGYMSSLLAATASGSSKQYYSKLSVTVFLSITNKMQSYTILFITVNTLHVSGGFSAHHQELKNCTHSIGYM